MAGMRNGKRWMRLAMAVGVAGLIGCSDDGDNSDNGSAPSQYTDVQFTDAGAFLPPKPTVSLCNPCHATVQCNGSQDKDALCVDYGDDGAFCGAGCASDAECTEGYRCADVKSVEGVSAKQCVRKPDAGSTAQFGACPCSDYAAAKAMSTQCVATFEINAAEKAFCPGTRYCSQGGLTACSAEPPSDERCDGVDNDCDGQTDEDTCTDAPVCQKGVCHVALGCQYQQTSGACDDGNACTKDDACFNGGCAGTKLDCDDGKPCTTDSCAKATGCSHTNADGAPCDDGEACTVADVCAAGTCKTGTPKDCNDGNPCTKDLCHKASGDCINDTAITDPCDDGNACTEGDACKDGSCVPGAAKACDDKDPCTKDSCDAGTGCVNLPTNVSPCDA